MAAIASKAEALPTDVVDDGDLPLLAGLELTPAQREMTNRVQAAIAADFELRRLMLLRRCDVTVRSFLRQKQGEDGKAENIPPGIRVRTLALHPCHAEANDSCFDECGVLFRIRIQGLKNKN